MSIGDRRYVDAECEVVFEVVEPDMPYDVSKKIKTTIQTAASGNHLHGVKRNAIDSAMGRLKDLLVANNVALTEGTSIKILSVTEVKTVAR